VTNISAIVKAENVDRSYINRMMVKLTIHTRDIRATNPGREFVGHGVAVRPCKRHTVVVE
jgi:hypothetical protein